MCDFYMGGYKLIVQCKGSVTSRSGCCEYKFEKCGCVGCFWYRQTKRQTDKQTERETDRETCTQAGPVGNSQTDNDRQTTER